MLQRIQRQTPLVFRGGIPQLVGGKTMHNFVKYDGRNKAQYGDNDVWDVYWHNELVYRKNPALTNITDKIHIGFTPDNRGDLTVSLSYKLRF